jgi:hypothetical protein
MAQVRINEFLAYNASCGYDTTTHNFSDWIELYNTGSSSFNIGGYYLTDNLTDTTKWKIPYNTYIEPHGFLLIWADGLGTGLHANFKLSSEGEEIGLFKPTKVLADSLVYIPQQTDVSFGRQPDGSNHWYYFDVPTPDAANTNMGYAGYTVKAAPPLFSTQGGFFTGSLQLNLTAASPGSTIRYTLDGSEPTQESAVFTSPISIENTTVVRARSSKDGLIDSPTATNTYFFDVQKDLPVFSLVCDSMYLWDSVMGIYANDAIDQERVANIEYFEDEQAVLNQPVGLQIQGFVARYLPQKVFGLYARNKYGKTSLDHKFFYDKDIHSFSSIFLRNGGYPDNSSSMLRDGFMQSLVDGRIDLDYVAYRPAVVYLNGKYWGLYNIREKQNSDFLAANCNIDPANIDYLENHWQKTLEGSPEQFHYFLDFITNNIINDPVNYAHVKDLIDVDNLIDYMITEIYFANSDWPGMNQKYWRSREETCRWEWMLCDVEFGFGMISDYDHNTLEFALATDGTTWANPPEATFLFRKMLENEAFRDEFIQRFSAHLNISFEPQRVIHRIDSFRNNVLNEMPLQIERWKDEVWEAPWGEYFHVISSMTLWEEEIEKMRQFALFRADHNRQHLIDHFDLTGEISMTSKSAGGYVRVNTVKLPEGQHSGSYFKDIPLRLEAVPKPGRVFSHWKVNGTLFNEDVVTIDPTEDLDVEAVFGYDSVAAIPGLVVTDLTLDSGASPWIAGTDIIIFPGRKLSVEPGVEILMPDSCCIIVLGELEVMGTEMQPCTIRPYTEIKASRWGAICIQDATGPVVLNHLNIEGASHGRNKQLFKAGITSLQSDVTLNHVSLLGADFPFYSEYGNITILNSTFTSDKTCDMINVKYAGSAIVENCIIKGNEYPDTDGIDYDQIGDGIIRNNIISGFAGLNSDGIDIGEGATGILIEGNRILNCTDKGISVGQASTTVIRRNFITGCNLGVAVKDSLSYAYIDQNTFYGNNIAVACFEKNWDVGGGTADVTNSILSKCRTSPLMVDSLSALQVRYSLSDTDPLPGIGNIVDDPVFRKPLVMNFELKGSSPCIDAGDPASPPDPDGSPADMGAYFVFQEPPEVPVVINEINYFSHPDHNSGDWLELYNNTGLDKNLSGWVLKDSQDEHMYRLPENFILGKNEYLVLCNNIDSFMMQYPDVWNCRGPFDFGLNREEETLRLFDPQMNLVDLVEYTNDDPWPDEPDGEGYTLQLIAPWLDNNEGENWRTSDEMFGNPGALNFVSSIHETVRESELSVYPNPSRGMVHAIVHGRPSSDAIIEVVNLRGAVEYRARYQLSKTPQLLHIDLSTLTMGVYILRVVTSEENQASRIVLY